MSNSDGWRRMLALCLVLCMGWNVLSYAFADTVEVRMDGVRTGDQRSTVLSELCLEDMDLPEVGKSAVNASASIVSAQGVAWEIPVLWFDGSGNALSVFPEEGESFPVLVFFIPEGYRVETGSFILTVNPSLAGLFGTGPLLSVYDDATGLFYVFSGRLNLDILTGKTESGKNASGKTRDGQGKNTGRASPVSNTVGPAPAGPWDDPEVLLNDEVQEEKLPNGGQGESRQENKEGGEKQDNPQQSAQEQEKKEENQEQAQQQGEKKEENQEQAQQQGEKKEENQKQSGQETEQKPEDDRDAGGMSPEKKERLSRLVDVYCSQTARDVLSRDSLIGLVDLIVNRVQPQAVNLLLDRFPAFREAADSSRLGTVMGLYIYFNHGDTDGNPAHEKAQSDVQASVSAVYTQENDEVVFGYITRVNASRVADANIERNEYVLTEDESKLAELDNTLVHEMMHAIMFDYDRVGHTGIVSVDELYDSSEEALKTREETRLPTWFQEGIATTVENNFRYRYDYFQLLRYVPGEEGQSGHLENSYTSDTILNFYTQGKFENTTYEFDLGKKTTPSTYVSGYLACLYIAEMAAQKENGKSSLQDDGSVSSEVLLEGMNSVFKRLNSGETLDVIIKDVSGGSYTDTDDFQNRFIKGNQSGEGYQGDGDSLNFCGQFLNYMLEIEKNAENGSRPNGSILFELDRDFITPLDRENESDTDIYHIIENNGYVQSSVPQSIAGTSGGKSRSGTSENNQSVQENARNPKEELLDEQSAAKDEAEMVHGDEEADPDGELLSVNRDKEEGEAVDITYLMTSPDTEDPPQIGSSGENRDETGVSGQVRDEYAPSDGAGPEEKASRDDSLSADGMDVTMEPGSGDGDTESEESGAENDLCSDAEQEPDPVKEGEEERQGLSGDEAPENGSKEGDGTEGVNGTDKTGSKDGENEGTSEAAEGELQIRDAGDVKEIKSGEEKPGEGGKIEDREGSDPEKTGNGDDGDPEASGEEKPGEGGKAGDRESSDPEKAGNGDDGDPEASGEEKPGEGEKAGDQESSDPVKTRNGGDGDSEVSGEEKPEKDGKTEGRESSDLEKTRNGGDGDSEVSGEEKPGKDGKTEGRESSDPEKTRNGDDGDPEASGEEKPGEDRERSDPEMNTDGGTESRKMTDAEEAGSAGETAVPETGTSVATKEEEGENDSGKGDQSGASPGKTSSRKQFIFRRQS